MSKNIRKRREKLWLENEGKCHYCGISTQLPQRNSARKNPPLNLATIDHLRTRLNSKRLEPNFCNEERTVLSCLRCNHIRGRLDQKASQHFKLKINEKNIKWK